METSSPNPAAPLRVCVLGVTSTLAAIGVTLIQAKPIGEDPFAMLGVVGALAVAGGSAPVGRELHLGFAAAAGFPVLALFDLALHGGHSLFGVEVAVYAVYGVGAAGLAHLARVLRRRGRATS